MIEEKDQELAQKEREGLHIPEFKTIKAVMHKEAINDIILRIKYVQYKKNLEREDDLRNLLEEKINIVEDYKNELVNTRILYRLIEGFSKKAESAIIGVFKSFLYRKCFNEIFNQQDISLFSVKYYLFIFYENSLEQERRNEELIGFCNQERDRNYKIEEYLEQLDMRCNLLTNNKINISNVSITKPRLEDVLSDNHQYNISDFSLIFYVLQTEPIWFLRMFKRDKIKDFIIKYVIHFYTGNGNEDYFLANLVAKGINLIKDNMNTKFEENNEAYLKNDYLFNALKLLIVNYFRGINLKLKNDIFMIIENLEKVEIENDPSKIFKNLFDENREREDALENETIKKIFVTRLKTLRGVIISIISVIEKNELPYPVKVFLKKIFSFTNIKVTMQLFYKEFIYPFLIASDVFTQNYVSEDLREKIKLVNLDFECILNEEIFIEKKRK
ncbi:iqgap- protein [Gurleya vavrai]